MSKRCQTQWIWAQEQVINQYYAEYLAFTNSDIWYNRKKEYKYGIGY